MRHFIFLTQEGLTRSPNNIDVENLQVLGTASGDDEKMAFENFIKENDYLQDTDYDEIVVMEIKDEKQYYFSLKNNV
jgi:hypothetical protein